MNGYVQVYTGDGKGKTTAALGLCLRAAGAGYTVFVIQFLKQGAYSEVKALQLFEDCITLEQYGQRGFIRGGPTPADIRLAQHGMDRAKEILARGEHDILVLEEINVAVALGLVSEAALLALIASKPPHVELILTGRGATDGVLQAADLVTEMKGVKHYYEKGVRARAGIEK